MSDTHYLKLHREVSVNPEFAPVDFSYAQNPQNVVVKMVSDEAVDGEMTDKVEFKNSTMPAEAPVEKSWYESAWDTTCEVVSEAAEVVEQGTKGVIIGANKYLDIQCVHDFVGTMDLDDENCAAAADMSANSENVENQKRAGEYASRITDEQKQLSLALHQTKNFGEAVREGYADALHKFHPENQAPTANSIVTFSCSAGTVKKVIENSSRCATNVQAEVTGAIADGINNNKIFDDETKTGLGIDLAKNIVNLDESQQAQSYENVANKLNQYQAVVDEVKYQVANVAKESVRQEAMARLQNSNYENVRTSFTQEAIQKAQEAFKVANGGEMTAAQAKEIAEAVKKDLQIAVVEGKKEGLNAAVKNANFTSNKAKKSEVSNFDLTTSEKVTNPFSTKVKIGNVSVRIASEKSYLADLQNCTSVSEFAKCMKNIPVVDLKNIFENISTTEKEEMFKKSQSVYLQSFLLASGTVVYNEVEKYCLPAVKRQINQFSKNNDIEYAIQRLNG